jgi:transcriptional regulator with XRE-family HTH domain
MSEVSRDGVVPQWDTADRLRKALRQSDTGVQEIADYLGVARTTVSNWINGRIKPSTQTLRLWALRCGVSYEWLAGGPSPHARAGGVNTAPGVRKGERRAPCALAA